MLFLINRGEKTLIAQEKHAYLQHKYLFMRISKKPIIALGIIFTLSISSVFAQDQNPSNLTNSPYSRYGMGKLGTVGNTTTRAMGDLGIGLRNSHITNLSNPASYTSIDTLTMLFDIGVSADWASFEENGIRSNDWNAGFSSFSFHFPLWHNFAMALSLSPYTMVGYNYGNTGKEPIEGGLTATDTLIYTNIYNGNGGLNKIMAGVGWKAVSTPKMELNVGVNASYIFGTVSHGGSLYIYSGQGQNTIITREFTARGWEFVLGAQLTQRISPKKSLVYGLTFAPKTPLSVKSENLKYSNNDTTQFNSDVTLHTPLKFGAGVTFVEDRKWIVGAEFSFENWSNVSGLDANLQKKDDIYKNITKFAVGMEYLPSLYSPNYLKAVRYRAGANVKTSYIDVYGSQNREYTVSVGCGFPVNKRSIINFATEYTHVQPSKNGLMSEDYIRFSLGLTFNEIMFFRNKLR